MYLYIFIYCMHTFISICILKCICLCIHCFFSLLLLLLVCIYYSTIVCAHFLKILATVDGIFGLFIIGSL